jgi:hypothetical protein
VVDGGDRLRLTLAFENPTDAAVTVFAGRLTVRDGDGGTVLTRLAGTDVPETRVPPGETAAVPVTVTVDPDRRDRLRDASEAGRLSVAGTLRVRVRSERVQVSVEATGVGAGG